MIIVTGATGFIGRRIIPKLLAACPDSKVLCLVKDADNDLEISGRRLLAQFDIRMMPVDLSTGRGLDQVPRSPRLVLNLAANTETADRNHSVNDIGLEKLYRAIEPLNSGTHFVQISTTALLAGRRHPRFPLTEETPHTPTNEYGRSKARAEAFISARASERQFCLTICRPTTVWGSGMRPDSFFDVLKKLVVGGSPISRLNWPGLTDLIHVDDAADLIVALSKKSPPPGMPAVYTLSSEALTLAQINRRCYEYFGLGYRKINLPKIFWTLAASSRRTIYALEPILPLRLYNPLWRSTLISDNVIHADTWKIRSAFPDWQPKKLADFISDAL